MNMILQNPEIIADQPAPPSSSQPSPSQFPQVSPTALRQRISELDTAQEELKDRLRRQEQATRNAIGVSILSTVLAVTAIGFTCWHKVSETRAGMPLVATSQANTVNPANSPAYPVLVTMR